MADFTSLLVFCQILGAAGGAVFALWAELSYLRALRDGRVDVAERLHLEGVAKGLRFGMTILLLASLGLVIEAYLNDIAVQPALTGSYWMSISLALLVIAFSWALSRRRAPFALSSAAVFSGWWFLTFISLNRAAEITFGEGVAFYVVTTAVLYAILRYLRLLASPETPGVPV